MISTPYQQYQLEKELANKLLNTTKDQRKSAYKIFYGEFFNKFPKINNNLDHKIKHKVDWQLRLLKPFLNKNITFMEIGAGNCLLSLKVANYVKCVTAYEVAELITPSTDLPANFKLKVFDGIDFGELDNSIDFIFSNDVFEHLHIEDSFHHVKQYFNMLKSGGKIIIVTPNSLTGPHDISRNFSMKPDGFHMKEYTNMELRKILKSYGFTRIRALLGHKKIGYYAINIFLLIWLEILYNIIPIRVRYKYKNNPILLKLFTIKITGTK